MMKAIGIVVVVIALAGIAHAQPADGAAAPDAARKACVEAMNADKSFAAAIVKTADEQAALARDKETVDAHIAADAKIKMNERHVIISYAGMWVIAAGFVIFLWRRQQALKAEIASLRRDLDAAGGAGGKGRA